MATIITYDLDGKHTEVKKAMYALGYSSSFKGTTGKIINLPNTTLYHATRLPADARKDLQNICTELKVKLERCIAFGIDGWAAIYGDPL
jgi:hypothetical protein